MNCFWCRDSQGNEPSVSINGGEFRNQLSSWLTSHVEDYSPESVGCEVYWTVSWKGLVTFWWCAFWFHCKEFVMKMIVRTMPFNRVQDTRETVPSVVLGLKTLFPGTRTRISYHGTPCLQVSVLPTFYLTVSLCLVKENSLHCKGCHCA